MLITIANTSDAATAGGLGWVDLVGISLVGLFTLLGIVRGLWWQVVRLLGVVLAVGAARATSPSLAPFVSDKLPELSPGLANGLSWFAVFVAALVAASLLGSIGKRSLEALQLGLLDRFGGALAGLATGALAHAAVLVGLCELAAPQWSQDALRGTHSQRLLHTLAGRAHLVLDAHAAERLEPWLARPLATAPAASATAAPPSAGRGEASAPPASGRGEASAPPADSDTPRVR